MTRLSWMMMAVAEPPPPARQIRKSWDFKLESVFVPVLNVDRAKAFYADQVGFLGSIITTRWRMKPRFVQLTDRVAVLDRHWQWGSSPPSLAR